MRSTLAKFLSMLLVLSTLIIVFTSCGDDEEPTGGGNTTPMKETEGLEFELNDYRDGYILIGMGTATDSDLVIPSTYNNLPVTEIGDCAMEDAPIKSIFIPSSIKLIGYTPIIGCTLLEKITVDKSNPYYYDSNNCLIDKEAKKLIACCNNFVLPTDGSITSFATSAFSCCSFLKNIVIPESVTDLGWGYTFSGCNLLESVTIPSGVTQIGSGIFAGTGLETITIPEGVASLGWQAFTRCSLLSSINLPSTLTHIQAYAFQDCSILSNINYNGTKAQWNSIQKDSCWDEGVYSYTVHCTDGDITKS